MFMILNVLAWFVVAALVFLALMFIGAGLGALIGSAIAWFKQKPRDAG